MEAEQEAVLTSMGEELDAACRSLARNGEDKLQVFYFITLYLMLCYFVLFVWAMLINNRLANEHTGKQLPIYTLSRHMSNMSNGFVKHCSHSSDGPPNPEKNCICILYF